MSSPSRVALTGRATQGPLIRTFSSASSPDGRWNRVLRQQKKSISGILPRRILCLIQHSQNQTGNKVYACSTLPARRHFVQTLILFTPPTALTLTFWTLEFQILLDLLCEWLTLFPKCAPLPQISHFATITPPHVSNSGNNSSILSKLIFKCKRKMQRTQKAALDSVTVQTPAGRRVPAELSDPGTPR